MNSSGERTYRQMANGGRTMAGPKPIGSFDFEIFKSKCQQNSRKFEKNYELVEQSPAASIECRDDSFVASRSLRTADFVSLQLAIEC